MCESDCFGAALSLPDLLKGFPLVQACAPLIFMMITLWISRLFMGMRVRGFLQAFGDGITQPNGIGTRPGAG